jgi:DNA-binding beta-propeller fold protein YncE
MKRALLAWVGAIAVTGMLGMVACTQESAEPAAQAAPAAAPATTPFQYDPLWPKELPHNYLIGMVIGVAVDSRDHIWAIHRPASISPGEAGAAATPRTAECCVPAPPVLEFDMEGNLVNQWGGPGAGYDWPMSEHGIFVDHMDNVWIGGNGEKDGMVLKFTREGKFLMQIGQTGQPMSSNSTTNLGRAADIFVDAEANEVYIADGYLNRRVIVFDANTGEYKRHWGAYGKPPFDGELAPYDPKVTPETFSAIVHCVVISNDDLVYVCDRANHRVQVFQKDGTFVKEGFIGRELLGASVWDLDFSKDAAQSEFYNADGGNHRMEIVNRDTLQQTGQFGRRGRMGGNFESPHSVAVDSRGNLYIGETLAGRRIQRFLKTAGPVPTN